MRQSGVALLRQNLAEVPKQPTQKDKLDERTLLQRSAISAIIPDPEFFQSSTQDGKLFKLENYSWGGAYNATHLSIHECQGQPIKPLPRKILSEIRKKYFGTNKLAGASIRPFTQNLEIKAGINATKTAF